MIHDQQHQHFQQALCELVAERGYTWQALSNLIRMPDDQLTDEGRWIKTVCVQAAFEHMDEHGQVDQQA